MAVGVVAVMMGTTVLMHMMMFGDHADGVATVLTEKVTTAAGLAGTNVHPEMMPVTMGMTV